jgi:hypothetical protein
VFDDCGEIPIEHRPQTGAITTRLCGRLSGAGCDP